MKEPVHYEFHGMDPSDWTENFLDEEIKPLLAWAPRRSTLRLKVERHHSGLFEGKLIIYSQGSAFVVEAQDEEDILTLCMSLKKRMKSKLSKWKSTHHHHPISRAG
jgi:hypothetical protein